MKFILGHNAHRVSVRIPPSTASSLPGKACEYCNTEKNDIDYLSADTVCVYEYHQPSVLLLESRGLNGRGPEFDLRAADVGENFVFILVIYRGALLPLQGRLQRPSNNSALEAVMGINHRHGTYKVDAASQTPVRSFIREGEVSFKVQIRQVDFPGLLGMGNSVSVSSLLHGCPCQQGYHKFGYGSLERRCRGHAMCKP